MRNDKLPMWTALANRLWWVSMGSRKGGDGEGGGWLPPQVLEERSQQNRRPGPGSEEEEEADPCGARLQADSPT